MHTIVLAIQKGGTGKSTLAVGLAVAAMQDGRSVRLIETDPQGTLSNWKKRRSQLDPIVDAVSEAAELEQKLRTFARDDVALTIVDTASGINGLTNAAIRRADLCLIPVRPNVVDIESATPTLRTIRADRKAFAFILNHTPVRGKRVDVAARTLGDQAAYELGAVLAQPYVSMRNHHQDALAAGLAVSEYAPSGKSADELFRLWRWVANRLDQTSTTYRPTLTSRVSLPSRFMDF